MPNASATPAAKLLTPNNHLLLLVDYQPQMAFAVASTNVGELRTNVAMVAAAARGFQVATIVSTVAAKSFSGPLIPEVSRSFDQEPIDRTTMNCWEDPAIIDAVNRYQQTKVVIAGLWTSVCVLDPVLCALEQGFDVYMVTDACADVSSEAHERAITRMVQAGAQPITALQYLLELQRDWARSETYELTTGIAADHGGAYGLGIAYAQAMLGPGAQEG